MKKSLTAAVFFLFLASLCTANELTSIRHNISSEKIRIVLDLSEETTFEAVSSQNKLSIMIPWTNAKEDLKRYKVLDAMIDSFVVSQSGTALKIDISPARPAKDRIFTLKEPYRIVIDLDRALAQIPEDQVTEEASGYTKETDPEGPVAAQDTLKHTNNIADGLSMFKIEQTIQDSRIKAFALLADPKKFDISPIMAVSNIKAKDGNNIFGSIMGFLGFSEDKSGKYTHFAKKTVPSFAKMMGALAAVNGSFFFADGTPVGALIINGQIISTPLMNRTALIIYKDGSASIDSVKMNGYLKLKGDDTLSFSGVNQPLKKDYIMVYTPDYQSTDPSGSSTNIVVENGKASKITYGETKVPKNGFIVSALGLTGDVLKDRIRIGDEIKWFFMASPDLSRMEHVIAGGPRLVHSGKACVTSKEERFRNDVAKSRAARTAVGITSTGQLIFAVAGSATLNELARLMIDLGAYDAMNLDGGGSSAMVVNGSKVFGSGRPVSNAIVISRK